MKKLIIAALLVAVLAVSVQFASANETSQANDFLILPFWFHVHTSFYGDGGGETPASIAAYLKSKGYKGVVLTPHSKRLSFPDFKKAADEQNTADFITITGREIIAGAVSEDEARVMCHINAVSPSENPPVLDHKYEAEQLDNILSELDTEKAFYVWNHPWACSQWEPYVSRFNGIELFNDVGPGFANGASYDVERKYYLAALKNGTKLFVISGIDMHTMMQTQIGDYFTYVFPDDLTRDSVVAAFAAGHTFAAFNAKVRSLSARPAFKPYDAPGGAFSVSGTIDIKLLGGPKAKFILYKNGEEYAPSTPVSFVRGKKGAKGYTDFSFSFGDKLKPGESACYAFEIPHYMYSSQYCYTAK